MKKSRHQKVKMKVFVAVLFLFITFLTAAKAQGDEKNFYSRRYDSIDVNTIFRSSRLLNNYVDCLLDKKPCPPEGKDLKSKKMNAVQESKSTIDAENLMANRK
jgi:hypothetical protein